MWNPGLDFDEARPATLHGYHRRLCIWSTTYRGTPREPGLVLGLDRGGSCRGLAYRVAGRRRREMLAYLFERELDDCVYEPRLLPVRTEAGPVQALCFIADPHQRLYAGKLSQDEILAAVLNGRGRRGTALDYLVGTLEGLAKLGIRERRLRQIAALAAIRHTDSQEKGPDAGPDPLSAGADR